MQKETATMITSFRSEVVQKINKWNGGVASIILKMSIVSGYNILVSILFWVSILLTILTISSNHSAYHPPWTCMLIGLQHQTVQTYCGSRKVWSRGGNHRVAHDTMSNIQPMISQCSDFAINDKLQDSHIAILTLFTNPLTITCQYPHVPSHKLAKVQEKSTVLQHSKFFFM